MTRLYQGERLALDYEAWATLAQSGDRGARELLAAHLTVVLRPYYLRRRVPESDVDDMVQLALLDVFQSLSSWQPSQGRFSTWMYSVARHRLSRETRDQTTQSRGGGARVTRDPRVLSLVAAKDDQDREIREELAMVFQAIERLPSELKQALLQFLKTPSYEEAARELGWNVHTFRSRLGRARRLLSDECKALP